jgi:phosphate-selective porin
MLFRTTKLMALCLLTFTALSYKGAAQERAPVNGQATADVEILRKKLEAQEAQLKELKESLSRQNDFIERQQKVLEGLQQSLGQLNNTPATPPATTTGKAIDEKPATSSKPAQSPENEKIKVNGLIQGWYASGNDGYSDTFLLRRAELRFSGQLNSHIKWMMVIDPAKSLSINKTYTTISGARVVSDANLNQSSRILQDAYITFDYSKKLQVQIGQFKVPLSFEGLQANAKLDTVERALFASDRARGGNYGAVWDTGVMLRGTLSTHTDYQVGLFNGSGERHNDADKNDQKALIGRLLVRPSFIKGLQIGGSGAWGGKSADDRPRRDRLGAEMVFSQDNFTFKSELMAGKDSQTHRLGYYTHFGYRLTPKLEALFRFDSWDPDTRIETSSLNVAERDYVAGFNYFITENNVKFQFNYIRKTFAQNIVPSRNLLLANLQTSW